MIIKTDSLPSEIMVKSKDVFELFEPVAERLGIKLELKERLPMLEEARSHMNAFFRKTMFRQ